MPQKKPKRSNPQPSFFPGENSVWKNFLEKHGAWWNELDRTEPIYHLPEPVVRHLAGDSLTRRGEPRAMIKKQEADAENAFRETCSSLGPNAVGIWNDQPVIFPLFSCFDVQMDFSANVINRKNLGEGIEEINDGVRQKLGEAGHLLLDGLYRKSLAALKKRWDEIGRPLWFPFLTNIHDCLPRLITTTKLAERLPHKDAVLFDEIGDFLRKHQIQRLATWELPVPDGRLEGLPAGLVAHSRGPNTPVIATPAQHDIPSNVDLRRRTRSLQASHAELSGLTTSFPVTGTGPRKIQLSEKAQVFLMWFVERIARTRYPERRGLIAGLRDGFAECLADDPLKRTGRKGAAKYLSHERIDCLRKKYRFLLMKPI